MSTASARPAALVRPFVISRTIEAPRDLVFKCWTEHAHIEHWWGPKGVTAKVDTFEPRPGGISHYRMTLPDGTQMWGKSIYKEITPPSRVVFINGFSDAQGNRTRHPLSPTWPLEMLTTVTFTEDGPNRTTVTVVWTPINPTDEERTTFDGGHDSMKMGWTGTFDQLAGYVRTIKA